MVQALRPNTRSKFTFADSKRFNSLVADIFVGVAFEDVAQPELEQALHEECQEAHLVVNPTQVHYVTTTYAVAVAIFVVPKKFLQQMGCIFMVSLSTPQHSVSSSSSPPLMHCTIHNMKGGPLTPDGCPHTVAYFILK